MKKNFALCAALVCTTVSFSQKNNSSDDRHFEARINYLNALDAPAENIFSLGTFSAFTDAEDKVVDLNEYVTYPYPIKYEVISSSDERVAKASIVNDTLLVIDFLGAGQTNVYLKGSSGFLSVTGKLIIGVYPHISEDCVISNFTNLSLMPESYWDGSDGSGGFRNGLAYFPNEKTTWAWTGWVYSNKTNNTTSGYSNQFSAITGSGFEDETSDNRNYGVGYVSSDWITNLPLPLPFTFNDSRSHIVKGLYVTNSTYAALSMEHGDDFAKKFGGAEGNDPDYLKLLVWGLHDGTRTDTVEFYLADYRFEDNSKDFIIQTWHLFCK